MIPQRRARVTADGDAIFNPCLKQIQRSGGYRVHRRNASICPADAVRVDRL